MIVMFNLPESEGRSSGEAFQKRSAKLYGEHGAICRRKEIKNVQSSSEENPKLLNQLQKITERNNSVSLSSCGSFSALLFNDLGKFEDEFQLRCCSK